MLLCLNTTIKNIELLLIALVNMFQLITSAKEVMFSPVSIC